MAQECAKIAQLVEIAEGSIPMGPSTSVSVALRDMPRGGNDAVKAAIDKADGYEQWYRGQYAELVMLAERVEDIIVALEPWQKDIIRAYYIQAMSDSEVAMLGGYPDRRRAGEARAVILKTLENACVGTHTAL